MVLLSLSFVVATAAAAAVAAKKLSFNYKLWNVLRAKLQGKAGWARPNDMKWVWVKQQAQKKRRKTQRAEKNDR